MSGPLTAKEKHKLHILEYISDWNNPFPCKNDLASVCGVKPETIYYHFTGLELDEILNEGLELRKKNSAIPRGQVYKAMLDNAVTGNPTSQREFLDRTEGKVTEKREDTVKIEITKLLDHVSGNTRGLPNIDQDKLT
jgi:AcrR family transcriptional regulator